MTYIATFGIALGASYAALALKAQLLTTTGATSGAAVTTGFAEIGLGNYLWTGTLADDFRGAVAFQKQSDSALLAVAAINVEELNPFATPVPGSFASGSAGWALGQIGLGSLTVVSALSADGATLTLVDGDDYTVASSNGPAATWSSGDWPTLTGGAALFSVNRGPGASWTKAGTITAPTTIRLELTAADLAAIGVGVYSFDVQVTLTSLVTTLVRGTLYLVGDVG